MDTLSNMTSQASRAIYGTDGRQPSGSTEPASGVAQNKDSNDPTQPYDGGNDENTTRKMDASNDSEQNDSPSSTNAGPHDSNIAGKADPRVDSDRGGRNGVGNATNDDDTNDDPKTDPSHYKNTTSGGGTGQHVESLVDAVLGPPDNPSDSRRTEPSSDANSSSNTETRLTGDKDTETGPSAGQAQGGVPQGRNVTGDTSVPRPNEISSSDETNATNRDKAGAGSFTTGGYEPSAGAQPGSGDQPKQKQQGADRPTEQPTGEQAEAVRRSKEHAEDAAGADTTNGASGDSANGTTGDSTNDTSGGSKSGSAPAGGSMPGAAAGGSSDGPKPQSESQGEGTGEKWVKTSGLAADGGDFDATKPGAGKEADRLLEEKGVHRSGPPGTGSSDPSSDVAAATEKKGLGEKVKEKLHLHKH